MFSKITDLQFKKQNKTKHNTLWEFFFICVILRRTRLAEKFEGIEIVFPYNLPDYGNKLGQLVSGKVSLEVTDIFF